MGGCVPGLYLRVNRPSGPESASDGDAACKREAQGLRHRAEKDGTCIRALSQPHRAHS